MQAPATDSIPTFLIAGAAKCGTTTLWRLAGEHPQVRLARLKEPAFFTRGSNPEDAVEMERRLERSTYWRGIDWYRSLFDTSGEATAPLAFGEASAWYFVSPDAPELIRHHAPQVRLVFLLRDPVERLYSHYWHELKHGYRLPKFEHIVQERGALFEHFSFHSSYRRMLARYLDVFPRSQVKVFRLEDLAERPHEVLRRFYEFIGVDASFRPPSLGKTFNPAGTTRHAGLQRLLSRSWIRKVRVLVPSRWHSYLAALRLRAIGFNTVVRPYEPLDPLLRASLRDEFAGEYELLAEGSMLETFS